MCSVLVGPKINNHIWSITIITDEYFSVQVIPSFNLIRRKLVTEIAHISNFVIKLNGHHVCKTKCLFFYEAQHQRRYSAFGRVWAKEALTNLKNMTHFRAAGSKIWWTRPATQVRFEILGSRYWNLTWVAGLVHHTKMTPETITKVKDTRYTWC